MAWNEPGKGDKDPWGGGRNDQGPPDIDEVVRNMKRKLNARTIKQSQTNGHAMTTHQIFIRH